MALLEVSLGWTLWFQNFTPFPVVCVCMHYLGIKMLQSRGWGFIKNLYFFFFLNQRNRGKEGGRRETHEVLGMEWVNKIGP